MAAPHVGAEMKKTKTKAKTKPKKEKTVTPEGGWRNAAIALGKCARLTLNTNGKLGVGSGMVFDQKTKMVTRWEKQFFDALDTLGIVYDRDKYYASKRSKR